MHPKVRLVGAVSGKPNHMATIHLSKGAPKSTRLDAIAVRKRAATKGDLVVEVKPGEEAVSVNVAWTVEKFVEEESGKKNGKVKPAAKKKAESGKKKAAPAKKAKAPATAKKPAAKKSAAKAKKAPAKKKK